MKNKATLSLIEQIIMILVFALSAAISLKIFAYSDSLSREKTDRDRAVLWAQNAAEALTAGQGDFDAAAELIGAKITEPGFEKELDYEGSSLVLRAEEKENANPLLGEAEVTVFSGEKEIYSLRVCWQEGEG